MAETSLNSASGALPKAVARSRLVFGPFTLDLSRGELLRDGQVIALRPKAFGLLVFLTSRPQEVLTKDQLIAAVWPGVVVTDDSLTQCVHELRAALGDAGSTLLHTVPRRGYRFDADVQAARPAAPAAAPDGTAVPVLAGAVGPPATPAAPATPRSRRLGLLLGALLLIAVVGLSTLAWTLAHRKPPAAIPPLSIVLLPLQSQDDAQTPAWFADALTADLTAEIGRIASVFVIATGTAATYKGQPADPREVARALGVRYVVRGAVQRSGEQVRLALAMVDGESGTQQWAQSFDIERSRLRASLDDIVLQVARGLNVQMYRSDGARAAALSPEQVQADDLAMQGWGIYFRGVSRANFAAALPLFEQAVAMDPRSIMGWGGVAVINGIAAAIGWLPDRDAALRRVQFASARLDELDSEHLFALLAKQHIANLGNDLEAFVAVTKMTIQHYPNHAPSYGGLSRGLMSLGRFDECVELSQRAMRLSPRDPLLGAFHWHLGNCHFVRGEYKEAAAAARLAGQISPNLPLPPLLLAASLARDGQADEARPIVAAYMQRHPDYRAADIVKIMHGENPRYAAERQKLIDSLHELGMP